MPTKYTVTGSIHRGSVGASGQVKFRPDVAAKHTGDDIYLTVSEVEVSLDSNGSFSVVLYGTDDAGWEPADWQWVCTIRVIDGSSETFKFDLTADSDLTDLLPSAAPPAP